MSPISSDDLHRIFKSLDKNNKGQVSIEELHHLLHSIGIHTTLEEVEKLVGKTSLDYIDFFFFYEAMIKAKIAEEEEEEKEEEEEDIEVVEKDLVKAFKVFDLNSDGYICCEELQKVLSRLGLWDKRSGKDCKDMIGAYDQNSDGLLDFHEFKNMMSVPPPASSDS